MRKRKFSWRANVSGVAWRKPTETAYVKGRKNWWKSAASRKMHWHRQARRDTNKQQATMEDNMAEERMAVLLRQPSKGHDGVRVREAALERWAAVGDKKARSLLNTHTKQRIATTEPLKGQGQSEAKIGRSCNEWRGMIEHSGKSVQARD